MPPRNELGREAVSALATAVVIVGGIVALIFVIVVGTDDPGPYLGGLAIGVVVVCLLLFLTRSHSEEHGTKRQPWWRVFRRRNTRPEPRIVVERRDEPGHDIQAHANQPPTVEQVKDLKEHGSTWVPNRAANQQ